MPSFIIIRPGATDFDDQGRIKGTLDIPLNGNGSEQVARTVDELHSQPIDVIYSSPCQSARQTATALGENHGVRVKVLDQLENVDHGLWQGKLISEVKQTQPRIYKQCQDRPESVCPPGGEPLDEAQDRVKKALVKLLKKHRSGVVALVAPEPLASMVHCLLDRTGLGDLWQSERDTGRWEVINVEPGEFQAT